MRSKAQAVLTAVRRFLPYFVGFNALAVAAQSRRSRSAAHSFEFQAKQRDKEEGKHQRSLFAFMLSRRPLQVHSKTNSQLDRSPFVHSEKCKALNVNIIIYK